MLILSALANHRLFRLASAWVGVGLTLMLWPASMNASTPLEDRGVGVTGFVTNHGQWPENVLAHADWPGLRLFVQKDGLRWVAYRNDGCHGGHREGSSSMDPTQNLKGHAWEQRFAGASAQKSTMQGLDSLGYPVHYLRGSGPSSWAQNLYPVRELRFPNFYPGIDWVLRVDGDLKYEFHVHPGVDPGQIRMEVAGVTPNLNPEGRLVYPTRVGDYLDDAPVSWVNSGGLGAKTPVSSSWKRVKGYWTYHVGPYASDAMLVIDPRMIGATYSGSGVDNWGFTATYDNAGNMYLGGIAFGPGYPTTLGAFVFAPGQNQPSGNPNFYYDVALTKYSPNGGQVLFSTYLGGLGQERPSSLIFDENAQSLLVFGRTNSANFPITAGAYQPSLSGSYDLFVTRLSSTGSLLASTYLGGSGAEGTNAIGTPYTTSSLQFNYGDDSRGEVVVAPNGDVLIVSNTQSANYPVTSVTGTLQATFGGAMDGVVSRLSPNLNQLLFSTFLGGGSMDATYAIKPGGGDTVFVAGSTFSQTTFFPNITRGYDLSHNGQADGYVMMMRTGNPPFSPPQLVSLTYCGTTSYDQNFLLERDSRGHIYVAGISMGNIIQSGTRWFQAGAKHYIQKYSPFLDSLYWSAPVGLPFLNGVPQSAGPALSLTAFLVDRCGKIYLSGWGGDLNATFNSNIQTMRGLPITANALQPGTTGSDMYLLVLAPDADTLVYATYLGGSISEEHVDGGTSRFSPEGIVYHAVCAGCRGNSDFPVTSSAVYPFNQSSNCNALIFKLDLELVRPRAGIRMVPSDTNVCVGSPIRFENTGTTGSSVWWTIGAVGQPPLHSAQTSSTQYTFTTPGTYRVRLVVEGCQQFDTTFKTVVVTPPPVITKYAPPTACPGDTVWLRVDSLDASGGLLSITWVADPFLLPGSPGQFRRRAVVPGTRWFYFDVISASGCVLRDSLRASTMAPKAVFGNDTLRWCWDRSQALQPLTGFRSYRWFSDPEITNQNQTVQNFSALQPRWVYCRAFDDTCFHVDSVYLLPEIRTTVSLGPDLYFCQQINRTLVPTGGVTYEWSDGSTGNTYNLNSGGSGFVWVIARDADGCRSLPDTLYYFDDPVAAAISISPSDTAFAPQAVYFFNQFSPNIDSVYWFFGDGSSSSSFNPVHSYTDTGTFYGYMLAFSTRSGCRDSIPFVMVVDTVVMDFPNAFLPETDGVNALFRSFTRNLLSLDFKVYDRWGQKIFETTNVDVLWDGTQGGKAVMPGTYVYTADGIGKNGADYFRKGLIHVVR